MRKLIVAVVALAVLGVGWRVYSINTEQKNSNQTQNEQTNQNPEQPDTPAFDKTKYSLTNSNSIWVVVNKLNQLSPKDYIPADLTVPNVRLRLASSEQQMKFSKKAIPDLEAMMTAAKNDGIELVFGSGYRSYALQKQFYDSYVAKDGVAEADRYSARPGHSEHQTGLAVDFTRTDGKCHLEICFEETPEGKWLAANAYKFGFIMRYRADKEPVTGYQYEPWHFRYVGKELAEEMNKQNITTLEEFFNLPAAPSY